MPSCRRPRGASACPWDTARTRVGWPGAWPISASMPRGPWPRPWSGWTQGNPGPRRREGAERALRLCAPRGHGVGPVGRARTARLAAGQRRASGAAGRGGGRPRGCAGDRPVQLPRGLGPAGRRSLLRPDRGGRRDPGVVLPRGVLHLRQGALAEVAQPASWHLRVALRDAGTSAMLEPFAAAGRPCEDGLDVDTAVWRRLTRLAERCLVEGSEESRQRGAGAGLIDTD